MSRHARGDKARQFSYAFSPLEAKPQVEDGEISIVTCAVGARRIL